jgi:Zn-finger protein
MCPHANTHIQIINTSVEIWKNGIGEWIEQESGVKVCDDCGAMFNKETGRWEL